MPFASPAARRPAAPSADLPQGLRRAARHLLCDAWRRTRTLDLLIGAVIAAGWLVAQSPAQAIDRSFTQPEALAQTAPPPTPTPKPTPSNTPARDTAPAEPESEEVPPPSKLDAPLFYQLLIGELELRQGEAGTAFAVLLDAARRTKDENLFQRALEIALRAQAGNEALSAANAWRQALPQSLEAVRAQVRILLGLNRVSALAEPLRRLIDLTPTAEREASIASLPRLLQGHPQPREAAQVLQQVLIPLAEQAATRDPAQLALARVLIQTGQGGPAFALVRDVALRQPGSPLAAALAIELIGVQPQAETLVTAYLARPDAQAAIRLGYAQSLASRQQLSAALVELRRLSKDTPELPAAWFNLGSVALEAGARAEAESALKRFLELHDRNRERPSAQPQNELSLEPQEDRAGDAARLMLSQLHGDRGDFEGALRWLLPLDPQAQRLDVQTRRAILMARQGKIDQARATVRAVPETGPRSASEKALAEAQVLRTVERWRDARSVLTRALERDATNTDLMYDLSLILERLARHEEMEQQLRRIIELKPDHHHAHNALGYSYAERGIRLDEAQKLVSRALELAPGDPFITDSLAWVAYRQGRLEQAEELLRGAYRARPDTEIGTHLAEVLWARGQRDEARQIWRDLRQRDGRNRVLQETLVRLKVDL